LLRSLLAASDHQLTAGALVIGLLALWLAAYAVRRSNENSSAATLVTLYDGLRQAWQRFLSEPNDGRRQFELSELMNLFELTCATEGSFVNPSKELLENYLESSLRALLSNAEARARIPAMLDSPDTFKYISHFVQSRPDLLQLWSSLPRSAAASPSR
jgi:hypothetical protein